jgi:hypothetical protein
MTDLNNFILSFGFNFIIALVLVRFIYYPTTHNKHYVFTFLAFNTIIYFVLSFLTSIEIGIGVGFGLFAILSILRYRTDPIPVREMTYLFIIAALPVMNSLGVNGTVWPQLIVANLAVLAIIFILEKEWGFRYETSRRILYERIELIRPERRRELLADLETRTGLKIKRLVIGKVNFMRDTADLRVYYDDPGHGAWIENTESQAVTLSRDVLQELGQ